MDPQRLPMSGHMRLFITTGGSIKAELLQVGKVSASNSSAGATTKTRKARECLALTRSRSNP